jgi:hypothetical protein
VTEYPPIQLNRGEHEPSLTPATAATRSRARQASETVRAEAYREGCFRRMRRQAATITRAVRAGRARVRPAPVDASVDGEALAGAGRRGGSRTHRREPGHPRSLIASVWQSEAAASSNHGAPSANARGSSSLGRRTRRSMDQGRGIEKSGCGIRVTPRCRSAAGAASWAHAIGSDDQTMRSTRATRREAERCLRRQHD